MSIARAVAAMTAVLEAFDRLGVADLLERAERDAQVE